MHLRGTFTCVGAAAAVRLRAQGEGGRIICVGSPTGRVGNVAQSVGQQPAAIAAETVVAR